MHIAAAAIAPLILTYRAVLRRFAASENALELPVPEVIESTWEEWQEQCAAVHDVAMYPAGA